MTKLDERSAKATLVRLGWFAAIWAMSVAAIGLVAAIIRAWLV